MFFPENKLAPLHLTWLSLEAIRLSARATTQNQTLELLNDNEKARTKREESLFRTPFNDRHIVHVVIPR